MQPKSILLALVLAAITAAPASAQIRLDMNKITCRAYLAYDRNGQDFVRFWMSGYYNAAANSSVLDYDRMQRNTAKVTTYCMRHKSATLPTAIKDALK